MGTNGAAGCYVLVRSVTYAQSLMRALRTRGIRSRMVRSPKSLSENGCAQAVLIRESSPGVILSAIPDLYDGKRKRFSSVFRELGKSGGRQVSGYDLF